MWKKLLNKGQRLSLHNGALAVAAGVSVFLAFEKYNVVPLIVFFPALINAITFRGPSTRRVFLYGFLTSFVIMLGGFYWVVYVLHEFGYLPWFVAGLLFLVFCGFGALNFPLYAAVAHRLQRKVNWKQVSPTSLALWAGLGLPALYTFIEWAIPKLFPWYIGHCLYRQTWLVQIAEITGTTYLTFMLFSLGSVLGFYFLPPDPKAKPPRWAFGIPFFLISIAVGFSAYRFQISPPDTSGRSLSVAMVQANIGSLEKVAAEKGMADRVRYVVDKYMDMTRRTLAEAPADLVLWPETAMPFQMESEKSYPTSIKRFFQSANTTFIIGAYEQSQRHYFRDYNSAFLFEPGTNMRGESYQKNILLAFGEYLPLGDRFPSLYQRFPQVSDFERGDTQRPFVLKDGTRLGMTICYEAIVPSFYRKVARNEVHAVVNLTNDSWFGPTSEPYLHGSLTPFRAIETRVPFFRVTNTGISFAVDVFGKMSETTPVYEPSVLRVSLPLPKSPPQTIYTAWGDWFIGLCVLIWAQSLLLLRRK